jgi:hypothetical protein
MWTLARPTPKLQEWRADQGEATQSPGRSPVEFAGKWPRLEVMLVGDTGFEPVTSSVSVISGSQRNAAIRVNDVPGCIHLIAECRPHLTSSWIGTGEAAWK